MHKLIAPFPYFGGKSKIADTIWEILGDVDNFVDPFMGSMAILLARPDWHNRIGREKLQATGMVANVCEMKGEKA